MTTIVCDMCKKTVKDAVRGKNYYTVREKDICRPCMKQFNRDLEDHMETVEPYTLKGRVDTMWDWVEEETQ
jgi:uncharacterized CHY-type Zn-finger protein